MKFRHVALIAIFILSVLASGCSSDIDDSAFNSNLKGSGSFTYTQYQPFMGKDLEIFYHVPASVHANMPICVVFHGNGRDALESRDALVQRSEQNDFIVIVPEFTRADFPGGDGYIMGNIFIDGDNPSTSTLNPEEEWTFSVIDSLFSFVKDLTNNTSSEYDVVGFSGGAQIAHRFAIFKPNSPIRRMVISSAGWYTVPDNTIDFPYGLQKSPAENSSLTHFFELPLTILVGAADNDPNASSLRRNAEADEQGTNRVARAQHFFTRGQDIAQSSQSGFRWKYQTIPNAGHDMEVCLRAAVDVIY